MKFNVGDVVKVTACSNPDQPFSVDIGFEAPVLEVYEGTEFPYELEGCGDCFSEDELTLVEGGSE